MKGMNTVIAIVLVAVCLLGWVFAVSGTVSQNKEYNTYIEQADAWVNEGLYQRAIQNYKTAIAEKPAEELYSKTVAAYVARYEEAPEETEEEYSDFLEEAVAAYPKNEEFVKKLAALYFKNENYSKAYACLRLAVDNGVNSEEIKQMLREAKFAFSLRGTTFSNVRPVFGTVYTVERKGLWGTYDLEEGYLIPCEYTYVSQSGDEGTVVVTGENDSRLISGEGVVLGIFENKVTDAGVYSEGLVAVSCGGSYAYYDEFAKQKFGDYEAAGTFQNGKAAVRQNGKWFLINTSGEKVSAEFSEIVLDAQGRYMNASVILVADTAGSYAIYDENFKLKAQLTCDAVDICTEDGLIAARQSGAWGYVNTNGEWIIQPKYAEARSFSNGIAAVCVNGLWGFIDQENNIVIECTYTDVGYFDELGICMVRVDVPEDTKEETPDQDSSAQDGADETPVGTTPEEPDYPEWKMLKLKNGITEG